MYLDAQHLMSNYVAESGEKKLQRRFLVKHVPESRKISQKFLRVLPGSVSNIIYKGCTGYVSGLFIYPVSGRIRLRSIVQLGRYIQRQETFFW